MLCSLEKPCALMNPWTSSWVWVCPTWRRCHESPIQLARNTNALLKMRLVSSCGWSSLATGWITPVPATVGMLTETKPWVTTGRTIIGDSWFGSPEMARKLLQTGLHSIMQVAKLAYWPKWMPVEDIVQAVGLSYGGVKSMVSTTINDPVFVVI